MSLQGISAKSTRFSSEYLFPRSGMRRPSLGRDIRFGVVEPYVIIYRYRADTVTVARIVDGRRNITRQLVRE